MNCCLLTLFLFGASHGLRFQGISSEPVSDLVEGNPEKEAEKAAKAKDKADKKAVVQAGKDALNCKFLPVFAGGGPQGCRGVSSAEDCGTADSWYENCCKWYGEQCVSIKEKKAMEKREEKGRKITASIAAETDATKKAAREAAWAMDCNNPKPKIGGVEQPKGCTDAASEAQCEDTTADAELDSNKRGWWAKCCEWADSVSTCFSVNDADREEKEDKRDIKNDRKDNDKEAKKYETRSSQSCKRRC